jgi:hypothetical protein
MYGLISLYAHKKSSLLEFGILFGLLDILISWLLESRLATGVFFGLLDILVE